MSMLPYLAKGFADVITIKDPELRLPWIMEVVLHGIL